MFDEVRGKIKSIVKKIQILSTVIGLEQGEPPCLAYQEFSK
jgi:hypothetical protein